LIQEINPAEKPLTPPQRVANYLRLFFSPGDVFEIRGLECSITGNVRSHTQSGYFSYDQIDKAAEIAFNLGGHPKVNRCSGVYFTINPLQEACLLRCGGRIEPVRKKDHTASDKDTRQRKWLLIDCDPVRPSGVSSSNEEHEASLAKVTAIRDHLTADGWPSPILANSGNGYHLLYRIDLPADDGGLIRKCLHAIAARFNDDWVTIDRAVFNPARICKLYGTIARKGDETPSRPHRRAVILEHDPSGVQKIVPQSLLESLAATAPVDRRHTNPEQKTGRRSAKPQSLFERAEKYLLSCQRSIQGQNGSAAAIWAACQLVEGFDLSPEHALQLLLGQWNDECQPPWSESELRHKVEDAMKKIKPEMVGHMLRTNRGTGTGPQSQPVTTGVIDYSKIVFGSFDGDDDFAESEIVVAEPQRLEPRSAAHLSGTQPIQADDDPKRLAELFVARYRTDDSIKLRFWREEWRLWNGRFFELVSKTNIELQVAEFCQAEFTMLNIEKLESTKKDPSSGGAKPAIKVTRGMVGNVMQFVQSACFLKESINAPSWVGGPYVGREARDFVSCSNGVLDIAQWIENEERETEVIPHSPHWFSIQCLDYDYNPAGDCPIWSSFLRTNLQNDQDAIDLLQEWFGYCLTNDVSMQKFMMLEGEGKNGKSVICTALTAILGEENVSHVSLELFGEKHSLIETLGKQANIVPEVGEMDRVAEGYLKSFTSGDRMTFERKYKDAVTARPTARLLIATNNRPRFVDRSEGLWRRMLLLPLSYQVPDGQRIHGMDTIAFWKTELPGMLNWALTGLESLRKYKRFTEPEISKVALAEFKIATNPTRQFLTEFLLPSTDHDAWTASVPLYKKYKTWCQQSGFSPLNDVNFSKEVYRAFPKAKKGKRKASGRTFWVFFNVAENGEASLETDF
jgi:P4 family phage/plasmid primase-like protien